MTAGQRRRIAIAVWLLFLAACGIVIAHTRFTSDLSAFLPTRPTPEQRLLLDQLSDGLASRLILTGIEGGDAATRARLSKAVAQRLRADPAFVSVNNGEPISLERDRVYLFDNRYLLSPALTPEHMSVAGLQAAIGDSIDLIASPAGMLTRQLLPRDPTGEMLRLLDNLGSENRPHTVEGVWASRDGNRALLLIRTRAPGSNTDAQESAMAAVRAAFDAARQGSAADTRLAMSGPGVLSVISRATIKHEVHFLSIASGLIIVTLLLLVYRSPSALVLGLLPVVSGALVGIATVGLGFGAVHGITLGFGTALIGEAVDYSIYLFVQSEAGPRRMDDWVERYWPTVRLGVLTSIAGFAALLLSSFPGLAQLGLYAISGLVAAALSTRFVLPHLLPASFRLRDISPIGRALSRYVERAGLLRWPAAAVLVAACGVLAVHRDTLWNTSISSLNPLRAADMALEASLRKDISAPDARYFVAVAGAGREAALQAAERASVVLQALVDKGTLTAFESPSRFLPSAATQRARQASLPPPAELESRLTEAVKGLPIQAARLTPFREDVERARRQPLLTAQDLEHTSMSMAVDAMLASRGGRWTALLPLTPPAGADIDASRVRAALNEQAVPGVLFVDLKAEYSRIYDGYLHEAILLSLGGFAALLLLLLAALRSLPQVLRVIAPLVASVLTVSAGMALFGHAMTILHLVGLLLIVAIGSNYALFFNRPDHEGVSAPIAPLTLTSMLLANLTTVTGFGMLALSNVSVLQAMGSTVAPGVVLALLYAAIFARTK